MKPVPTHVMHLIFRFATGGLENGLVNIINKLSPHDFYHTIVCLDDYDREFASRLRNNNVKIICLNKAPGRSLTYLWTLRKLIKSAKPDIIHSRGLAALEAQVAGLFLPVVRLHGEHGWDSAQAKSNKKYQFLRRILNPIIKRFVVLSQEGYEFLHHDVGISDCKIERICNGVDTEKFLPVASQVKQGVHLITVGRLAQVKNQQLLIQAMACLTSQHGYRHIHLSIFGEGECRPHLQALIDELALSSYCRLAGQCDNVAQQLSSADVFILPSFAEGISNTILESMACGIPVVASNVGGNMQLVKHDYSGYLFASDNVQELVDGLIQYIEKPELRTLHGLNARQRVNENFSLNKMVDRYQQLYLKTNSTV